MWAIRALIVAVLSTGLLAFVPLERQTDNVCARPPERLQSARASEAAAVTMMWQAWPGTIPMVISSPACRWRCDGASGCVDNLMGYLRHTCRDSAFELGMSATDREYHDATHARFAGRMMKAPDALIKASLDFPGVSDFKKELARLGYKHFEFASTSVPNPPNGFGRVLVLIEGDDFDQWYQIAATLGPPRLLGRNVDLAVVQKKDEGGKPLTPHRFYMNGYSRLALPTPQWEQEGLGSPRGLNRCIMCHPSGLRGIFPVPGSVPAEEEPTLREIQKKLDGSIAADFGGYYDPRRLGPVMGPIDPPSRPALLARCAPGVPAASVQKIGQAMNCAKCHDGKYRGYLHAGADYATISHKITSATPDGIMPIGPELSRLERLVLASCLKQEYGEQFKSWLTEARCSDAATPPQ